MTPNPDTATNESILIALRRVIRAVDEHNRRLAQSHGLTGPQALVLRLVTRHGSITAAQLGHELSLTAPTISDIIRRMEQRGLITRVTDSGDRRRQLIKVTESGLHALDDALPLMQERFLDRLAKLPEWEQSQLLASLQHLAALLDGSDLQAAPLLTTGAVTGGGAPIEARPSGDAESASDAGDPDTPWHPGT